VDKILFSRSAVVNGIFVVTFSLS